MTQLLWKLPVPVTALLDAGPTFEIGPRRKAALRMAHEVEDGEQTVTLAFDGVEAYKVTYYLARSDAMLAAYGKLLDLGETDWLRDVRANIGVHGGDVTGLSHLMIDFDDGPCYEVICRTHRVEEKAR